METVNWQNIEIGLKRYQEIMNLFKSSNNVAQNELFKSKYKTFYRLNQARKSTKFYDPYFELMHKSAHSGKYTFSKIIGELYKVSGKKEFSFSTKLISTIDSNMPVWDSKVRNFLNRNYKAGLPRRFKNLVECASAYDKMCKWYKSFMATEESRELIAEFERRFPDSGISNIKKLDLIFWQTDKG